MARRTSCWACSVILALAASEERRHVRAGVLVALAAFAKPYALIFLPWLAVTLGVAAVGASLAARCWLACMAPAVVYGWQGNLALLGEWYRTVTQTTSPNLLTSENISFAAVWARWIGDRSHGSRAGCRDGRRRSRRRPSSSGPGVTESRGQDFSNSDICCC